MAVDLRRDPATTSGALRCVGDQLGVNAETLRNWVSPAEVGKAYRLGPLMQVCDGVNAASAAST